MAKTKRRKATTKPLPWNGDHGPGTQAATAGTELQPVEGDNPNRMARRQRRTLAEIYRARGLLTKEQADAAEDLLDAWEETQTGSTLEKVKVDIVGRPKGMSEQLIWKARQLAHVTSSIPKELRAIVFDTVIEQAPIENRSSRLSQQLHHFAALAVGLQSIHEAKR